MSCKYKNGGRCELLTATCDPRGFHVPESFCVRECSAVDMAIQKQTLRRFKVELPDPPEGKDLLEWAKECVADGTVKMPPQAVERQKQKEEYEKIIAELPSRALQFDSLRKHAVEIVKYKRETGRVFVSDGWKAERLKLGCEECDKLRTNPKTRKWWCGCCGCNVVGLVGDKCGKADFEALSCEHWKEIDAAFFSRIKV